MTHVQAVAWFITPHGFGHATRSAAIMQALHARLPHLHFHIVSRLPEFLFDQVVPGAFTLHDEPCDVGLVQQTAMEIDFEASLRVLNDFYPLDEGRIANLAARLSGLDCSLVCCDIAPLGIAVAKAIGCPSVLIENFTFHWIYESYTRHWPGFEPIIAYLRDLCERADLHIQTEPISEPNRNALHTAPVARRFRNPRSEVRRQLGVPEDRPLVMITMGGIRENLGFLNRLASQREVCFLLPGTSVRGENIVPLPEGAPAYHPDLIHAADLVIGKLGYSTFAEVYHAGVPFGFVTRPNFPESVPLAAFVRREMPSMELDAGTFLQGDWLDRLPELLSLKRVPPPRVNGATQIAERLAMTIEATGTSDRDA